MKPVLLVITLLIFHTLMYGLYVKLKPFALKQLHANTLRVACGRDYAKGVRNFCGIDLPEGLEAHQKLDNVLITPSTKGIITGVPEVPEVDDVNITRENIENNLAGI